MDNIRKLNSWAQFCRATNKVAMQEAKEGGVENKMALAAAKKLQSNEWANMSPADKAAWTQADAMLCSIYS